MPYNPNHQGGTPNQIMEISRDNTVRTAIHRKLGEISQGTELLRQTESNRISSVKMQEPHKPHSVRECCWKTDRDFVAVHRSLRTHQAKKKYSRS